MNNYKKFGVVAGQVFMGLGFSLLGGIVGLICDYIVSVTTGIYSDLFGTIVNALIGCYIGLLFGVCFDGYKFLNQDGRQNEFLKFLLVSVVGISGGLFGLYLIVTNSLNLGLSNGLTNFLAVALPLIGTLLGSILILTRDTKQR
jgi:H+/Cl- antiporter ClcA